MPTYKYRAKKDPVNIIEGKIDARSEKEAIEKINQLGVIPMQIEELRQDSQTNASFMSRFSGKVTSREVTVLTRQLSSLLKSGVPILSALSIISEQSENTGLKNILRSIYNSVKDGATFSSTLLLYPQVFSQLYIAMVRIGENSGALPQVLLRIADYRAKQEEMFSRFRMAMAYPILMATVGIGTIVFMFTFVMPRLMNLYVNMEQALPLPTKILIALSESLNKWGLWIVVVLAIAVWIINNQLKTALGKAAFSVFKLHLPLFGKFIVKAELARFSRTLELLLKSGIPILKALEISIPVLDNEVIKNQLKRSCKELEQGGSFGKSLKSAKIFPLFMSNLIVVGEESGKLDDALSEVANSYEHDTDETIRIMGSLIEPLMILVMGIIVGFIVVAMLLPIFEINVMVK